MTWASFPQPGAITFPTQPRTAATGERADLVIMGTHGRAGLTRMLLGSVAERVIKTRTLT